jgi:hypothetical protein
MLIEFIVIIVSLVGKILRKNINRPAGKRMEMRIKEGKLLKELNQFA